MASFLCLQLHAVNSPSRGSRPARTIVRDGNTLGFSYGGVGLSYRKDFTLTTLAKASTSWLCNSTFVDKVEYSFEIRYCGAVAQGLEKFVMQGRPLLTTDKSGADSSKFDLLFRKRLHLCDAEGWSGSLFFPDKKKKKQRRLNFGGFFDLANSQQWRSGHYA